MNKQQTPKQAAFYFFLRNAGYSVKPGETQRQGKARTARELAKAERDARALGYTFEWSDDWTVGSHKKFYGEDSAYCDHEPDTCESCVALDAEGNVVASLGCVDDATREYRRVVEAELALEALS